MISPTFVTSKEARDAGWYSRRNESRHERDAAQSQYMEYKGRKARQLSALKRHKEALARYEEMKSIEPENWGKESNPVSYCEYKIRVTKRTIAAAQAKLGIWDTEYGVKA